MTCVVVLFVRLSGVVWWVCGVFVNGTPSVASARDVSFEFDVTGAFYIIQNILSSLNCIYRKHHNTRVK